MGLTSTNDCSSNAGDQDTSNKRIVRAALRRMGQCCRSSGRGSVLRAEPGEFPARLGRRPPSSIVPPCRNRRRELRRASLAAPIRGAGPRIFDSPQQSSILSVIQMQGGSGPGGNSSIRVWFQYVGPAVETARQGATAHLRFGSFHHPRVAVRQPLLAAPTVSAMMAPRWPRGLLVPTVESREV